MRSRDDVTLVILQISQQESDKESGIGADIFPVAFEERDTAHDVEVYFLLVVRKLTK